MPPAAASVHCAVQQARLVVRNALFGYAASVRRRLRHASIYTDPEIAEVGLSEPEATRTLKDRYRVVRAAFAENDRARATRETYGLAKLVADRSGRILGAGVVGPSAGELISLFALAIAKNLTVADLAVLRRPASDPRRDRQPARRGLARRTRSRAPGSSAGCKLQPHVAIVGLALYDGAKMTAEPRAMPGPFSGLSVKLITTIVVVILAVEVVIYLPSVANFRADWLDNRLRIGIVAGRVLDAVPDVMALPRSLTDRLLIRPAPTPSSTAATARAS